MLALSARALDAGYMIVVVLAGLKDDLRTQTARRFNVQLLRQRDPVSRGRAGFTLSQAESERRVNALAPPYFLDCHQWALFHVKMTQALARGEPVVAVIKKNSASLATMRERIRQAWSRQGAANVAVLVLDDECDEASVEPVAETPTPELIANLWRSSEGTQSGTVAYVGYTATVAANLLQKQDNELYPSDFVYQLRVPAARESLLSFREPVPHSWYCGGETFYQRFIRPVEGGSSLLVESIVTDAELAGDPINNASLKQALRTFLTSAAIRSLEHPERWFDKPNAFPEPHSMIVQASTAIADHAKWARAVGSFLGLEDLDGGASASAVQEDIDSNGERWQEVMDSLGESRIAISELQPHPWPLRTFAWTEIVSRIQQLIPQVRLRVLNSAPGAVDELEFESTVDANGERSLPQDLFSIIVGGGRLSRGLTIEGLSVSYFSRWADVPAEDTILQLSRWYGYRGRHLDYCRVFTTPAIAAELAWIHEHDQELRHRLATLMQQRTTPREAGLVLSSIPHGLPTAKLGIGRLRDVSFSPCCRAITAVEIGAFEAHNESVALRLVSRIRARGAQKVVKESGGLRGLLSVGWPVEDIIDILDELKFTTHNPRREGASLGSAYRPHDADRPISSSLPEDIDPYSIAAYLRLWKANLTHSGGQPPTFSVGVSYGSELEDASPFDIPLGDREVSESGFVNGSWIGASERWPGDQFFDGVLPALIIDGSAKRKEGAEGLLLLYILHKNGKGKRDRGVTRQHHSPMIGISIPAGGPTFRRVILEPEKKQS